jgi:membrane protease YdiL (CAAX protease family)
MQTMKWALLPLFWAAIVAAGYFYSQDKGVAWAIARLAGPAFVLEATLFLAVGIESWRARLEKLSRARVAVLLVCAAVAPYLAATLFLGSFSWTELGTIAGLSGMLAFWYVWLPHNPLTDMALLAFAAIVVLMKPWEAVYDRPDDRLAMEALGQAMWIRTGLLAVLCVRRIKNVGFGFWPQPREWMIGTLCFLAFLPIAVVVGTWLDFTHFHAAKNSWLVPLTFFGALWVLALGEELFFRGLLQQWLTDWLRNKWAALVVASAIFGAAHLWKDWKLAVLAGIAGLFYGFAFQRGRSIRAAMVTHALTVTAWKTFFS